MTWLLIAIGSVLLSALSVFWVRRVYRRKVPPALVQYSREQPSTPFTICQIDKALPFNKKDKSLSAQSESWRQQMSQVGEALTKNQVKACYFIHGTFAGDDPFGLIPALRRLHPKLTHRTEQKLKDKVRSTYNRLSGDIANFHDDYVKLFSEATSFKGPCQSITWSSANHHAARLLGALQVLSHLEETLPTSSPGKIMLWAHSHGGQTLALLSQLLDESPLAQELWAALDEQHFLTKDYQAIIKRLKQYQFDLVTFGTPIRYPWQLSKSVRLINIINHRGSNHLAQKPLSFWRTSGGDYVQQWGIAGSDAIATSKRERLLNRKLDTILGIGADPKLALKNIAIAMRVPAYGKTFLVDYQDDSLLLPNFMTSIFGHGIYTRYQSMLFNCHLMVQEFYK